ncbi:MAG TPA: MFS transporter [Gemmatimonadales bacterium]|nr:MFS transporter [Gemmatimonadales bacterium]
MPRLLERIGLHRPELRAWALYDWANSAMVLVVVTAVFPIYFATVAAAALPPATATFRFSLATTAALTLVALLAPLLGAVADYTAAKKRMLAAFLALGVVAVALMVLVQRGDWLLAALLFVLANVGANGSFVFYDALLPHVARPDEVDRVSTTGYALGYLGSGLLLAVILAAIQRPAWFGLPAGPDLTPAEATLPTRLGFLAVALWWAGFAIPLFRRVPEPPRALEPDEAARTRPVRAALARLGGTLRSLRAYRDAAVMLLAFLIYNDGIGTIIRMATIYGTEIGIGRAELIASILLVQFVGIPCSFLFGALARPLGAKRTIVLGLVVYTGISVLGYFMTSATHFLVLAALVGMVQGGTQALSRSLFASMVPPHRSGEFFGFFAVVEKFAGIFGPALFALAIALTGSSRSALLSVIGFFVIGGALLALVDVERGRKAARSEAWTRSS